MNCSFISNHVSQGGNHEEKAGWTQQESESQGEQAEEDN